MLCSHFPATNEYPICLSQEEWLQPKSIFKSLFEDFHYLDLKKDLRGWLKVVCVAQALPKRKILRIDDIQEQLLRLLEVGYLLDGDEKSTLPEDCNWMNTKWWLGQRMQPNSIPFDYFPHSLSKKEYCNPYRVFYTCRATYSLPDWRLLLRDCFATGACADVLYEMNSIEGALDACRLLPKLIEAAYLIYVREFLQKPNNPTSE